MTTDLEDGSDAARQGAQGPARFVGRSAEVAELTRVLGEAAAVGGRFYLLTGSAGMGKTRLAEELTGRAREQGFLVAWGRCWEGGEARPYWPWTQILRVLLRDGGDLVRDAFAESSARSLELLVPELADNTTQTEQENGTRTQLFDGIVSSLQRAAVARPLLLVFDDLHAADEASLLLLRFFAAQLPNSPIVILGTCQREEVEPESLLAETLTQLRRAGGSLALRGLDQAEVAHLFELMAGHPAPESIISAVHQATEGCPLFVHEIIAQFISGGDIHRPDYSMGFRVPEGAREVIGQRLARVDERVRHLLSIAAVIGRDFDAALIEDVTGIDQESILEQLSEGVRTGILREESALGRFRFSHVLMRETLYEALPAALRMRMHRDVAQAIEASVTNDAGARVGELAHHYFKAGQAGDIKTALDYCIQAARRAEAQLAFEEAIHHYRRALRLADALGGSFVGRQGLVTSLDRIGGLAATSAERATASPTSPGASEPNLFSREADFWTLSFAGKTVRVKHMKGLEYLSILLRNPGREIYSLDLVQLVQGETDRPATAEPGLAVTGPGDAGEILDAAAKRDYRRRLNELREEIEEAEANSDLERASSLRAEMDFLVAELAAATGLGGRDRKAASAAERARLAATRAIKTALAKIKAEHAELGLHLDSTIRTGNFFSYTPDARVPIAWAG